MQNQAIIDLYNIKQINSRVITLEVPDRIAFDLYQYLFDKSDYTISYIENKSRTNLMMEIGSKEVITIDELLKNPHISGNLPIIEEQEEQPLNTEYIANIRRAIGSWIKEYRDKKGITQGELANQLGVTFGTVSKIESGKWMSLEVLIKISTLLSIPAFNKEITKKINEINPPIIRGTIMKIGPSGTGHYPPQTI